MATPHRNNATSTEATFKINQFTGGSAKAGLHKHTVIHHTANCLKRNKRVFKSVSLYENIRQLVGRSKSANNRLFSWVQLVSVNCVRSDQTVFSATSLTIKRIKRLLIRDVKSSRPSWPRDQNFGLGLWPRSRSFGLDLGLDLEAVASASALASKPWPQFMTNRR